MLFRRDLPVQKSASVSPRSVIFHFLPGRSCTTSPACPVLRGKGRQPLAWGVPSHRARSTRVPRLEPVPVAAVASPPEVLPQPQPPWPGGRKHSSEAMKATAAGFPMGASSQIPARGGLERLLCLLHEKGVKNGFGFCTAELLVTMSSLNPCVWAQGEPCSRGLAASRPVPGSLPCRGCRRLPGRMLPLCPAAPDRSKQAPCRCDKDQTLFEKQTPC